MSLRLQIHLIMASMLVVFASLVVGLQVENTRRSVREEIEGASVVATQLLSRIQWVYASGELVAMQGFLSEVGRIRANEVTLYDEAGHMLYRSPPTQYKFGREAPLWYANLVSPPSKPRAIQLPNGRLILNPDSSRAALDGWDDLKPMLGTVLLGFVLANLLVFALVGRVLRPFQRVVDGLRQLQLGEFGTRLPDFTGQEAQRMGQAFNRMAQSVQDGLVAREQAQAATLALAENRELTQIIQSRIEEVRGAIARELHDELGQQVTAIKSAGMAIARRAGPSDPAIVQSAELVIECANQIYDGVHQLIGQLRPLALDQFGLSDAVEDLVDDWRTRYPDMSFRLAIEGDFEMLDEGTATAAYRIIQEAGTNAIRHARASLVDVRLQLTPLELLLEVSDDGEGQIAALVSPGHFGVLGMRERTQALGGKFAISRREFGGISVTTTLPKICMGLK